MNYYSGLKFLFGAAKNHQTSEYIELIDRNYFCLQYNHGGVVNISIDGAQEFAVTGPSLLLTFPGKNFRFGCDDGTSWLHNAMGFTGPKVEQYIKSGLLPIDCEPPVFQIKDSSTFFTQFQKCCFYISQGERYHHRAAHTLESLLIQLYDERTHKIPRGGLTGRIHELSLEIAQYSDKEWDFTVEAENMNISYAHFRRLFKQVTGTSPQKYLQNGKLSQASELLLTTNMPIKEIAWAIGIEDIHYFTRIFSSHYELPPGKFRELHSNQKKGTE